MARLEMTKFVPSEDWGKEWNHTAMLKALTNRPRQPATAKPSLWPTEGNCLLTQFD